MMKKLRVDGGVLRVGQGTVLGLTNAQAGVRAHNLESMGDDFYKVRATVEFKSGEEIVIDLADVPKNLRQFVIDDDAPKPEPDAKPAAKPARTRRAA